jgi:hypothetical protein
VLVIFFIAWEVGNGLKEIAFDHNGKVCLAQVLESLDFHVN